MILRTLVQFLALQTATPSPKANDTWITMKSRLAVITTANIDSRDVHLDTTNGVVTLYGKAENTAAKKAVEKSIVAVTGVVRVENLLQIVPPGAANVTAVSDEGIKNNIEAVLKDSPALKGDSFKVLSVDKGLVMLGGKAKEIASHIYGVALAGNVAGVKRVETKVEVENDVPVTTVYYPTETKEPTGSTLTDAYMTTRVKLRLIGNENVPATQVHVDTWAGVVVLFGRVDNELAKKEAEAEAAKAEGVWKVRNEIIVDTKMAKAQPIADKDIEASVKKTLSTEDVDQLAVTVNKGVIKLSGKVHSEAEKARVAFVSRSAKGARAVKNDLEVNAK